MFVDNIFRFVQAGSEVSTLLGRMPSAVGYQPTLADEMGELQERITSTKGRSITSLQAVYVPADDYTDPAPFTTFTHLDATTELVPPDRGARHLPGGRPARVDVQHPGARDRRPASLRRRPAHAGDPAALQGAAGHHRHPRSRRALRRGPRDGGPGPQDPEVPDAAVLRGRGVHRSAGHLRAGRGDGRERSRRSSAASSTTCPSRRSSTSAASSRCSPRPRRLPRARISVEVQLVSPEQVLYTGDGRDGRRAHAGRRRHRVRGQPRPVPRRAGRLAGAREVRGRHAAVVRGARRVRRGRSTTT